VAASEQQKLRKVEARWLDCDGTPAYLCFSMIYDWETLMGSAKAALMKHEDNLNWAKGLFARTHAIDECENHGYFMDNYDEEAVEDAIKLAAADPPRGLSPDEAAELVRKAIQVIGDQCPGCVSNNRE
jgi:hypothetical protein